MGSITLKITDATGARVNDVEVPDDQPNIRIMAALVQKLQLPLVGPDQQPMSYRFHHAESQSQLRDTDTLAASGVADGDTLRLVPEIVAG
jgi:uncharacterized ubiquitin-like protein YukD